ncbi:hypothetical protein HUU40_00045 [candidate division KSB1 bacterium]|nr:hypothetical protein [candidate division KSB1 bacterium]
MGQSTTLTDVTSGNTSLPLLIRYNTSDILAMILEWPTLRSFFDFSDRNTMTESGGEVVSVADLTGNFIATAAVGERAVYSATAINGQPGLVFSGTKKYKVVGMMAADTSVSWASCYKSTAPTNASQMVLSDSATPSQNLYTGGDAVRMFSAALEMIVPNMRNRPVNTIWTMNYLTDVINVYCDGISASGSSNQAIMSGDANIGAWNDGVTTNRWIGSLGYLAHFTEDASQNAALRNLLDEYKLRRWRG